MTRPPRRSPLFPSPPLSRSGTFASEQLSTSPARGDGMTLASRLEGANKSYGSLIMIGEHTFRLAREHIEARELDQVRVAGKHEPSRVFELLAFKGGLDPIKRGVVDLYARALEGYRQLRFDEAIDLLSRALAT